MPLSRILGRAVAEIGIFSFVLNMLLLVQPIYLLQVYDRVLVSTSIDTLAYISLIALAGIAVLAVLESVRTIYAARVANSMDAALAGKALYAAMMTPAGRAADIQLVQDLSTLRGFINSKTLFYLFDLPFAPIFLILLYFVHPALFYLSVAGASILVLLVVLNQLTTRKYLQATGQKNAEAMASAHLFARNAETVRALGMDFSVLEYWGGHMGKVISENDAYQRINSVFSAVSRFVRIALQIAILGVGAYLVLKGEMTAGMIFASSIISGRALQPLDQIIGAWRHLQTAWISLRRLAPLSRLTIDRRDGEVLLPAPSGAIVADGISYALPAAAGHAEPVLKPMSFSISAGECIGIVGPSGAGKSTLGRILAGGLRPSRGTVCYDKADISQWIGPDRGQHVGYLGQEIEFFPGTIAQNIARLEPGFDDAKVIAAAQKAGAHEAIVGRPRGYSAVVGPSGDKLSAGERQRVGLARALYGDPRIIILDEPNSNLDGDGQAALEAAVRTAKAEGRTVILILHRGPLLRLCDRVMVVKNGGIDMFAPTAEVADRLAAAERPQRSARPGRQSDGHNGGMSWTLSPDLRLTPGAAGGPEGSQGIRQEGDPRRDRESPAKEDHQ
ncbi:MAG: type I secretion system permease/ATPase [Notoacmeibacter sp.]|nr:type I secretion system permease/ATPase [Notoacmeibacter sp.]